MAEGTRDVSTDLEFRTDIQDTDEIIMVNPATKEVQALRVGDLGNSIGGASPIFSDDEGFDI